MGVSPPVGERQSYDAVVVGSGPAGAVAALGLARAGLSVLLVEKKTFPRPKVCGGCLSGNAVAALHGVGLWDRVGPYATPLDRFEWRNAGSRAVSVPTVGGWAIERSVLDRLLVDAAVDAGATFRDGTSAKLTQDETSSAGEHAVELRSTRPGGTAASVTAATIIWAAGLGGGPDARFTIESAESSRVGVGAILAAGRDDLPAGAIVMASGDAGYVGCVRLADGRLDAAAAVDRAALRAGDAGRVVADLATRAGLSAATVDSLRDAVWLGTPTLTRKAQPLAVGGVFLVGDAAGYVEPFTGEGIGWALASGSDVVPFAARRIEVVRDGRPDDEALVRAWAERYDSRVGREQRWCRAIRRGLRSGLARRAAAGTVRFVPAAARPVTTHLGLSADV
ncbi:MAG: FAD-dependent monooxygenase [Planctomycetota bacterium]